jgi:cytochrome c-type biogenesis protein CcmH
VIDRRSFLGLGAGALVLVPRPQQSQADRLYNAPAAGKSRAPVGELDNSEMVKGLERQLKCTCPCNLDVFTCRTTDFTCEYSPAMHREVMDLVEEGRTSEEVIAAFIDKYGERVLMAPRPVGFNLAGYLVPGLLVLLATVVLAVVLLRRHRRMEPAMAAAGSLESAPASPSEQDLERLKQALSEVAD